MFWSVLGSAYTIDFEEFAVGTFGPFVSGDFNISADCGLPGCQSEGITTSHSYRVVSEPDFLYGTEAAISVERSDGGAFALYSLDLLSGATAIYAETSDGAFININVVNDGLGALGQGGWLNIVSFTIEDWVPSGVPIPGVLEVDNIVVSAVPVPAAVWLFGSALAGLGFMRRNSTA
jgi:hypothetical protein